MAKRMALIYGIRTPIGSFGGGLKDASPEYLLAKCFREVLRNTNLLKNTNVIDHVIAGNVCSPSDATNIARVAALLAGVDKQVPAMTVQRNCASGLQAITSAFDLFRAGEGEIFLVGGTENMSQIPYLIKGARFGLKLQHRFLTDGLWEGLVDPTIDQIMGQTAEGVARKYNIGREEQDKFSVLSHQKALKASREGKFDSQITPIKVQERFDVGGRKLVKSEVTVSKDESINPAIEKQISSAPAIFMDPDISSARRSKAKFEKGVVIVETSLGDKGTVTPKNSCPISDGASAILAISEEKAEKIGLKPDAYITAYAYAGCDPALMGEGPIYAVPIALKKAGLTMNGLDFVELNEAFASQSIACQRELKIPDDKLNVWGGAIALGHPVGATGSYLTTKAMHILKEYDKQYAAITMCVGGGQGGCLIIENATYAG